MEEPDWLERLIEHEVRYTQMIAECRRTENAWILCAPDLPDFLDANRAIGLRTNGRSPEEVVAAISADFAGRGLQRIIDLDPVAEAQGFGAALERAGMSRVPGNRLLMRLDTAPSRPAVHSAVELSLVPNETGGGEAAEWIETAVADDIGRADEALWRKVAEAEAAYPLCRLYTARVNGVAAGACDVFEHDGWARLESVVTRPEMRGRGIATALVAAAVADAVTRGAAQSYLFTEPAAIAERLYRRVGFTAWRMNVFQRYRG